MKINIFYLHRNPQAAAQAHCNKHVMKMICETCSMLSAAHRVLDGKEETRSYLTIEGKRRTKKIWRLPNEQEENLFCSEVTHINHPATVWARTNTENYVWLLKLLKYLLEEYTFRYGKQHASGRFFSFLSILPKNLPIGKFFDPPLMMPAEYKVADAVISYQNLYVGEKSRFARWIKREPPEWYTLRMKNK